MTTGRINQIAIPTDESKDKSVAMKQALSQSLPKKRDLETDLLGALCKGEQS